jgi:hypothetical protein
MALVSSYVAQILNVDVPMYTTLFSKGSVQDVVLLHTIFDCNYNYPSQLTLLVH